MATFEKYCYVRGHHIYQRVWDAAIGETLTCRQEPSDRYAVAVTKDGTVIGHLLRKVSRNCSLFLRREGHNNDTCLINFTVYFCVLNFHGIN